MDLPLASPTPSVPPIHLQQHQEQEQTQEESEQRFESDQKGDENLRDRWIKIEEALFLGFVPR